MIYLDANATTPLSDEAREAMLPLLGDARSGLFGNPSSVHTAGQRARAALDGARERCAAALGALPKELVFTSGGTESAWLALVGAARAAPASLRRRVVTSTVEHPCVRAACARLEEEGFEVVRVGVDGEGRLDLAGLARALDGGAILCSLQAANHETGVLLPLEEASRLCRKAGALLHSDAVQLAGKRPLRPLLGLCDLVGVSGHKLGGPKGTGLLWVRAGVPLVPVQAGGGQEGGLRAGTESLAGAAGFSIALENAEGSAALESPRIGALRDRLEAAVRSVPGARVLGGGADRVGNTLSATFDGCPGQLLLVALDLAGIAASGGAACSSGTPGPSPVLAAMGLSPEACGGAIRFSLWRGNTGDEIDRVCGLLPGLVARLRGG